MCFLVTHQNLPKELTFRNATSCSVHLVTTPRCPLTFLPDAFFISTCIYDPEVSDRYLCVKCCRTSLFLAFVPSLLCYLVFFFLYSAFLCLQSLIGTISVLLIVIC
ncbi:hypothetical protein JB92DRAFT_770355 [Gautieria morchelliformis]|nr:hypothetical protein JB92DRAFT_770355 [Gautieria morchelliformis]